MRQDEGLGPPRGEVGGNFPSGGVKQGTLPPWSVLGPAAHRAACSLHRPPCFPASLPVPLCFLDHPNKLLALEPWSQGLPLGTPAQEPLPAGDSALGCWVGVRAQSWEAQRAREALGTPRGHSREALCWGSTCCSARAGVHLLLEAHQATLPVLSSPGGPTVHSPFPGGSLCPMPWRVPAWHHGLWGAQQQQVLRAPPATSGVCTGSPAASSLLKVGCLRGLVVAPAGDALGVGTPGRGLQLCLSALPAGAQSPLATGHCPPPYLAPSWTAAGRGWRLISEGPSQCQCRAQAAGRVPRVTEGRRAQLQKRGAEGSCSSHCAGAGVGAVVPAGSGHARAGAAGTCSHTLLSGTAGGARVPVRCSPCVCAHCTRVHVRACHRGCKSDEQLA